MPMSNHCVIDKIEICKRELGYAFKRRARDVGYKRRARLAISKLREYRHDFSWMIGLNPFDAEERRSVQIWGILKIKKERQ